jgi:hypothetical protein
MYGHAVVNEFSWSYAICEQARSLGQTQARNITSPLRMRRVIADGVHRSDEIARGPVGLVIRVTRSGNMNVSLIHFA